MAEYKLSGTASKITETLIFAGKEYTNTWVGTTSGSKTQEKSIGMQVFEDYLEIDDDVQEDIDDISSLDIFEIKTLLKRLGEYE